MTASGDWLLFERYDDAGELERIGLLWHQGGLAVRRGSGAATPLPPTAIEAVFTRFGRALDPSVTLEPPAFAVADGVELHWLRYKPRYDVIARDYLVLTRVGSEPLVELAPTIAAALLHLARAYAARAGA